METTILGYIGFRVQGWGYLVEKKMETTVEGLECRV